MVDLINDDGLTEDGAKALLSFFNERPDLRNRLGKTTQVDRLNHSTNLTEINVEDLRTVLELPETIKTGQSLASSIPNVVIRYNDYYTNSVCIDVTLLKQVAGAEPSEIQLGPVNTR